MLKINETLVRTSRNFRINNIEFDENTIPNKIDEFNNVEIIGETNNQIKQTEFVYGLGQIFDDQIIKNANQTIYLEADGKDKRINFKFDENNLNLIDNIQIVAKENSKTTITICYEGTKNLNSYHNGLIDVYACENAKLDVIIINLTPISSTNLLTIQNQIKENSKVNYYIVDFGGKNSITNYYSNLIGDNSDNQINTIYLGKKDQLFDINYIVELRGKKSNVNIEVQGALKDEAKKHFKGTIDFKRGCKKAKGNENESCMLLSNSARSLALPMLLCSEEDVEGNHSCSSGKVGNKELFYIMSRGFSIEDAMKLLVRAKFNNIISGIKDEELKEKILTEIDKKF